MTDDSENSGARLTAAQKREIQADDSAMRDVVNTAAGRRFMWNFLADAGLRRTPFVSGLPDQTSFNCGAQNLAIMYEARMIEVAPQAYALMLTENKGRKS